MKLLLRILVSVFLFVVIILPTGAWFFFPWYAQSLLDKALEGKPIRIEISDICQPDFSGIRFGSVRVVFITPPDGCNPEATSYTILLTNAFVSFRSGGDEKKEFWRLAQNPLTATILLVSDSLKIIPSSQQFTFNDENPLISFDINILAQKNLSLSLKPVSVKYRINNAAVIKENLGFDGISYNIKMSTAENWKQPLDTIRVARFSNDRKPLPVSNFTALFGSERDLINPCTLTLKHCSIELFQQKASADRIDYNLKTRQSRFILNFAEIPLNKFPGLSFGSSNKPFAKGQISGSIPVVFQDSSIIVRHAIVVGQKGSKIFSYTKENKPLLSLDLGLTKGGGDFLKNLNGTITIHKRNNQFAGVTVGDISANLCDGKITSTPVNADAEMKLKPFTVKLSNINIFDRLRLLGDFKGSLHGEINGTIPVSITKTSFITQNAQLHSTGGGTISIAPPSIKQTTSERLLGPERSEASYSFSEPSFILSREENGRTTINFRLKHLQKKTQGGEMTLLSPSGNLSLGNNHLNPNLISLYNFSTGFLDGNVAISQMNYDIAKYEGETTLQLNNIPLQKILDLQGTKKIFATGTIKGDIPIKLNKERFEILDGGMKAEQSGQIIYATTPEERAAANQGLRTTYEALSNFLYVQLISSISMAPDGQSTIAIHLKGTNPEFQGGRPIELNLNIQQNLLDLMRALSISSNVEQIISDKSLQLQKK
ncbi:MAG: hypothetical protein FDX21_06780 [Chlorobium sp.]|nr:MAG: hypothetical protein FDX21_06780 [Chlorobium sp.]